MIFTFFGAADKNIRAMALLIMQQIIVLYFT